MDEKPNMTVAGDWAKPANTLIERISEAIGGSLQPWQIKRVARADAEAKVIDAKATAESNEILARAGLEQSDVVRRAIQRMVSAEVIKQVNIENITRLALDKLDANAKPENVERDFISNLFEKAAGTSNEEMQGLWASILAGEANKPGTFSKRTLGLVAGMDRKDAEIFTRFCSCCFMVGQDVTAIVKKNAARPFASNFVKFDEIVHLESLGLLRFDPTAGFKVELTVSTFPADLIIYYFGEKMTVRFLSSPSELKIGKILLTDSGRQLARISGAKPHVELRDSALEEILAANLEIFSDWPRSDRQ